VTASTAVHTAMTQEVAPIALGPGEGESLWFLGSHASVKASADTTAGRLSVIEHRSPRGSGSPLHVHTSADEWFYVIEGEVTFWVGGEVIDAPAGSFVYGPRGIPHTFLVASESARFLLVAAGDFAEFMRTFAQPADAVVIPPPATEPPDVAAMSQVALEYGIEILGPPGIPA
jgi:quercetin dioxygenase-like cupin family protein